MTQGVGLSVGATKVAAVIPGCAALTRQSVLTLYRHRPPEVGVPCENSRLDERGLVVTDFVDRAADPVGIMAADGSFHRGETLIADALRALAYTATAGRSPVSPPGVAFPAHWRTAAVEALRRALLRLPEWSARPERLTLVPDAAAALSALQAEPGLPTRGVVALCDFGGTGTSITLADAADGYRPIGATVRHHDFSGELIDRALLAHVVADLSISATADVAGTAAIGSLHQLRTQCRAAKERLSLGAVTTLFADVPGYSGEVRLTRAELDDEIRESLSVFIETLREHMFRNRIRPADLAAVASIGGGARIPAVTTALSDQLRVPVISTARPELTAASGAALHAVRRPEDDSLTAAASPIASAAIPALAWSEVDDVPDIALVATESDAPAGLSAARPAVDFVPGDASVLRTPKTEAWYRPILVTVGVFAAMVLVGTGAVMAIRNDASAMTGAATTTTVAPGPAAPPAAPPAELAVIPEAAPDAPSYVQAPGPATRVVVTTPPPVIMRAPAPAPAVVPPPADVPPPPSAPPPSTPTTTPPTTSPAPSSPPHPSHQAAHPRPSHRAAHPHPSHQATHPHPSHQATHPHPSHRATHRLSEPPASEPATPPAKDGPPAEQAEQPK